MQRHFSQISVPHDDPIAAVIPGVKFITTKTLFLMALVLLTGCTQLSQAHRYFFNACAGNGPEVSQDFNIHYLPFDLTSYYTELHASLGKFTLNELTRIHYKQDSYPIYHLQRKLSGEKPTLLIVAGIHGNEQAALLAIPRLLQRLQSVEDEALQWNIDIIVPSNPIGAAHRSRYNGQGCDINRDFGRYATPEAQAIRSVLSRLQPDLVLAPHEGPQTGFFMIATAATHRHLAQSLLTSVKSKGIALADKSFLGLTLDAQGLSHEGTVMATLKRIIGLGTLGTYMEQYETGTITTESDWHSSNIEERINSHVEVILALLTRR